MNPRKIKCTLQWWGEHETMFLKIGFLVCQIIGIVKSQIEIERFFSLMGTLTNIRRQHLQLNNLEKLIFMNKNWSSDRRVDWKSLCNLVEAIEKDLNLKEELKEFERVFEEDEVLDIICWKKKKCLLFSHSLLFLPFFGHFYNFKKLNLR